MSVKSFVTLCPVCIATWYSRLIISQRRLEHIWPDLTKSRDKYQWACSIKYFSRNHLDSVVAYSVCQWLQLARKYYK